MLRCEWRMMMDIMRKMILKYLWSVIDQWHWPFSAFLNHAKILLEVKLLFFFFFTSSTSKSSINFKIFLMSFFGTPMHSNVWLVTRRILNNLQFWEKSLFCTLKIHELTTSSFYGSSSFQRGEILFIYLSSCLSRWNNIFFTCPSIKFLFLMTRSGFGYFSI